MAQITITIPDAALPRVISDLCTNFGYQSILVDVIGNQTANPETPAQFAKRMLVQQIKGWMRNVESAQAARVAAATSDSDIEGVNIT